MRRRGRKEKIVESKMSQVPSVHPNGSLSPPPTKEQKNKKIFFSMKFSSDMTIPHAINLEFKDEGGAIDGHIKGKIQIIEF